jgi:hypothetical protein
VRPVELRYKLGHNGLAIKALALPQRFQPLSDLGVHLIPAEPAALRQIPLDRLTDQLPRRTALLGGRGLYFRQQAGRDKGIRRVSGFHASSLASAVNESRKEAVAGSDGMPNRWSGHRARPVLLSLFPSGPVLVVPEIGIGDDEPGSGLGIGMGPQFGIEHLVEISLPRIHVWRADRFESVLRQIGRGEAAATFAKTLEPHIRPG